MGRVVRGGSLHPENGSTQTPGAPSGGCSREWGLRPILLVLPIDELVGLSRGGPEAPKQPAVMRRAVLWRRGLGSEGRALRIQSLVVGVGRLIRLPFLRLRKMNSSQCCLPKDSALVSKSILNNQINWERKFKIKTSRKRWEGSSGGGRGQGQFWGLKGPRQEADPRQQGSARTWRRVGCSPCSDASGMTRAGFKAGGGLQGPRWVVRKRQ